MGQTYPLPIPSDTPANANYAKPRYGTAGDWAVGTLLGSDAGLPTSSPLATPLKATCALASASGGAAAADYAPRAQNEKLTQPAGRGSGNDVTREIGTISPLDPYPKVGDTPAAAPVVTSIAPNTAVSGAAAVPLVVVITGTGFTKYSRVVTGGSGSPFDASAQFVSSTKMNVIIDPRSASPGTISVAVMDHNVLSNVDKLFTFT